MTKDELELKLKELQEKNVSLQEEIKNHLVEKQYLAQAREDAEKDVASYLKEIEEQKRLNQAVKAEASKLQKQFDDFKNSIKTSTEYSNQNKVQELDNKLQASYQNEAKIAKVAEEAYAHHGETLNLLHTLIENEIKLHNFTIGAVNQNNAPKNK